MPDDIRKSKRRVIAGKIGFFQNGSAIGFLQIAVGAILEEGRAISILRLSVIALLHPHAWTILHIGHADRRRLCLGGSHERSARQARHEHNKHQQMGQKPSHKHIISQAREKSLNIDI